GPTAWLERADGKSVTASMFSMLDDVDAVCTLLQKGEIVAIKGLGGIHLACDATQETAVEKLRQRKRRYHKPFALMARDIEVIEQYCTVNAKEKELLTSSAAPIVLLQVKGREGDVKNLFTPNPSLRDAARTVGSGHRSSLLTLNSLHITSSVAPGQNTLGFMLPYTPLHHLILR
ncbi:MAG: Sua5/YciO/YrdC/YwlC family protein, partial [Nostoc sp.]